MPLPGNAVNTQQHLAEVSNDEVCPAGQVKNSKNVCVDAPARKRREYTTAPPCENGEDRVNGYCPNSSRKRREYPTPCPNGEENCPNSSRKRREYTTPSPCPNGEENCPNPSR